MQAYGCDWVKTPGFDYVAANGLLFNNAYTSNAKCSPSRASILTGRNTWQLEEACIYNLADNPEYSTLVEEYRDQLFIELKEQGDPRMGKCV